MCEPEWLGLGLGIDPRDIFNCIPVDAHTRQCKKIEILHLWMRQKGKDATYRSLLECISELKDRQLVEAIVSMVKNDNEVGGCSLDSSSTTTASRKQLRDLEAENDHQ